MAVYALEHVHAITLTNIAISRAFHIDTLSRSKVRSLSALNAQERGRCKERDGVF